MMCVVGKASQGGPGSHITRQLSEARGTFELPERPVGLSLSGFGIVLEGCSDGELCALWGSGSRAGNYEGRKLGMGLHCPQTHY